MSLKQHRRRYAAALASVLLLAAPALTGCGSSAHGSGDGNTVVIGKAVDTIGFSAIDVAEAMGYFKDAGVNVETKLLDGSSQTTAALQGGSIQFATLSSTALLLAASKGVDLQAIASLDHGVSVQVVVSNDWAKAHDIDPSQPMKQRMEGLPGAKDAAISSTGVAVLKLLLSQSGVSPDSVDYVTVGSDAAGSAALGHGTLQLFVGSPPSTYYMARNADSTILASASEVPQLRDMAYDILITDPDYAKENPKVATGVATALARAENLMATDPEKVLDIEAKHFPAYSRDDLLKSLRTVEWTKDGQFTQPMWDDAIKASQAMDELDGDVDATQDGLWTNKYLDTGKMTAAGGAS